MEIRPDPDGRLAELAQALQAAQQGEQKCKQELETLRQRYADDLFAERQLVRRLREDRHRIQQDYERLRLQKGGFGIKMLMLSGFSGFMSAILLCALYVWFLQPAPDFEVAIERFRTVHLFDLERVLSEGHFEEVENFLEKSAQKPENRSIRSSIEVARKLVTASRQGCVNRKRSGYTLPAPAWSARLSATERLPAY